MTLGNNGEAAKFLGHHDENLKLLEEHCPAKLVARGNELIISGDETAVAITRKVCEQLVSLARTSTPLNTWTVKYALKVLMEEGEKGELIKALAESVLVTQRGKKVWAKTLGQRLYVEAMESYDLVFASGPAGTGKTYLAVVMAVKALKNKEVDRIILARPAVEAGEKLGFLPGDLQDKVNPYLRPLYDSLYDVLGVDLARKYMEKEVIEIAPLAYMRGRTLEQAFIILDEAQNTTPEQMKMFLTRMGSGSKAVVTGDTTQADLPRGQTSGLVEAQAVLDGVAGIAFIKLTEADVIRHSLVQKIVRAYESFGAGKPSLRSDFGEIKR